MFDFRILGLGISFCYWCCLVYICFEAVRDKFYIVNFVWFGMRREELRSGGSVLRKLLILFILIGLVFGVWVVFFSYEDCRNKACFDENLKGCDKVRFVSGDDMIFEYLVRGESEGACEVEVKLLQGELNNADSGKLEGEVMVCMLPLGAVVVPESDIGVCHGLLKEGLQDLVIRKLHTYLVQNLGRLNLEMADVPGV